MGHEMHIKDVAAQHVVASRAHVKFDELGARLATTVRSIVERLGPKGRWPTGAAFAIYHNQPFRPDDVDVEMGVPVASDVDVHDAAVDSRDLPAGRVAYTVHRGRYGTIGAAYDELHRWMREHGHTPAGPPCEVYLISPAQTDRPDEYLTEIDVPIR